MTIAFACVPSKSRPGYVNVFVPGKGWASMLPGGTLVYDPTQGDGNYQQFQRDGVVLAIAPGDDADASVPTYVVLPE